MNKGVAVLWYTDNLLYAEADAGDPEVGLYSSHHFFDSDKNIEFMLDEDFTEEDVSALEGSLEF